MGSAVLSISTAICESWWFASILNSSTSVLPQKSLPMAKRTEKTVRLSVYPVSQIAEVSQDSLLPSAEAVSGRLGNLGL